MYISVSFKKIFLEKIANLLEYINDGTVLKQQNAIKTNIM